MPIKPNEQAIAGKFQTSRDTVPDNSTSTVAITNKGGQLVAIETPAGDSAMDEGNDAIRVNIVAGAGSGGTAMTDDSAFTPGGTSFTPAGGTYRSVRDLVDDNDAGVFAMTQRRAILASIEDSTGDSAMDDANNALRVNIVAGAGSGGTAMTDEGAFTEGGTSFTPVGGVFNDTITSDPTEDQAATFRITAKRGLHTNLRASSGVEINSHAPTNNQAGGNIGLQTSSYTYGFDGSNYDVISLVTPADAATNTQGVAVQSQNAVSNGTTWDRQRGAVNALNSTGTGIAAAQLVGQFDDTTPTTITENQFGNVRMSSNRNLYGTIRDAAGNERGANVTAGNALVVDGSAVTQPVSNTVLSVVGGGTEATAQRVTIANDSTGVLSVDDNGSSLTIDNAALSVTGGGVEASALRVTIANDSTGVLSVDDNGSSLTVDGAVTIDTAKTIKTAAISVASSGDNTIVASVSSKRIKVFSVVLNASGTVSVKWKNGAGSDLTGAMDFQAREGYTVAVSPPGWVLATSATTALILNLSDAVGVRGWVTYWDDDAT